MVRIGLEESERLRKTCFINFLGVVNLDFSPLQLGIGHLGPQIRIQCEKLAWKLDSGVWALESVGEIPKKKVFLSIFLG